ncbi:MAG: hypothetical protein JW913_19450, partial [Chitinispirillaceae bacterium]|nr:hypothetical protein [Chitinispirillaceae bacterium]
PPRVFLRFSHVVFPRHLMHRHQKESLNLGINNKASFPYNQLAARMLKYACNAKDWEPKFEKYTAESLEEHYKKALKQG